MPVASFTRDADGNYPWLSLELKCLMAFPESTEEREAAVATLILEKLSASSSDLVALPPALLRAALAGPGLEATERAIAGKTKAGSAAGEVLRELLTARALGEVPRVSDAVGHITATRFKYVTLGGDVESMRAARSVENARRDFKSVVHFWAALVYLLEKLPSPGDVQLLLTTQPRTFVALAMDHLERASVLMSDNGSKALPLFDATDCWTAPPDMELPSIR